MSTMMMKKKKKQKKQMRDKYTPFTRTEGFDILISYLHFSVASHNFHRFLEKRNRINRKHNSFCNFGACFCAQKKQELQYKYNWKNVALESDN